MTTQEKIGQLLQPFGWKTYHKQNGTIELDESFMKAVKEGGVGSLYGVLRADPWTEVTLENGLSPEEGARAINAIQRYAIEHSRLGIPILFGEECSHGHMAIGATVFPVPILLGSMWNVDLYRKMCEAIAAETRSQGGAADLLPCAGRCPGSPLGPDRGMLRGRSVYDRGAGGRSCSRTSRRTAR